ncbi:MAG TPA: cyclic-di-AMP receptor [bacterium]|nr:cyclic-di-AMP receptor [bacterium]
MKLILAVVAQRDAPAVMEALVTAKLQVTKLASMGGFLKKGNVTLLIGTEDSQVDEALEVIKRTRPPQAPAARTEGGIAFVLKVDRFVRVDAGAIELSLTD